MFDTEVSPSYVIDAMAEFEAFHRRIFERGFRWNQDLTSFEDWLLYLELSRAGLLGAVVPERLFDYRVRPDSMMRTDGRPLTGVIVGEIAAHLRESEVEWTSRR